MGKGLPHQLPLLPYLTPHGRQVMGVSQGLICFDSAFILTRSWCSNDLVVLLSLHV